LEIKNDVAVIKKLASCCGGWRWKNSSVDVTVDFLEDFLLINFKRDTLLINFPYLHKMSFEVG
jgi:hypothetical protein